jgi:hypothetical protein
VDLDQLAVLRRLRAAAGDIPVFEGRALQASPQRKHQRGDRTVSDQERDGCNAGVPWSV